MDVERESYMSMAQQLGRGEVHLLSDAAARGVSRWNLYMVGGKYMFLSYGTDGWRYYYGTRRAAAVHMTRMHSLELC